MIITSLNVLSIALYTIAVAHLLLPFMQPSAPTQVCSLPLCLSAALLPCQLSFSYPLPHPLPPKPTHVLTGRSERLFDTGGKGGSVQWRMKKCQSGVLKMNLCTRYIGWWTYEVFFLFFSNFDVAPLSGGLDISVFPLS